MAARVVSRATASYSCQVYQVYTATNAVHIDPCSCLIELYPVASAYRSAVFYRPHQTQAPCFTGRTSLLRQWSPDETLHGRLSVRSSIFLTFLNREVRVLLLCSSHRCHCFCEWCDSRAARHRVSRVVYRHSGSQTSRNDCNTWIPGGSPVGLPLSDRGFVAARRERSDENKWKKSQRRAIEGSDTVHSRCREGRVRRNSWSRENSNSTSAALIVHSNLVLRGTDSRPSCLCCPTHHTRQMR